jgi:hypothetical protein
MFSYSLHAEPAEQGKVNQSKKQAKLSLIVGLMPTKHKRIKNV